MSTTPPPPPHVRRMPLLDGLRGVAAVAVMLHHEPLVYASRGYITRAYLAVDFFYMLSGLVLTLAYEKQFQRGLNAGQFMAIRVARLWPIIAVGVVLGAVGQWLGHGTNGLGIMLAMGLLIVPRLWGTPGRIYWLDGPQWSVAFELVGNAFHSALLWRFSTRWLGVFTCLMGAVLVWLCFRFGGVAMGDTVRTWWAGFVRVGFSYALGMWIGRLLAAQQASPDFRPQAPGWQWIAAGLVLPLIYFLAGFAPIPEPWLDIVVVFVVSPPMLWWCANVEMPERLAPAARWLGALSYPLYAVHLPTIIIGGYFGHMVDGPARYGVRVVVCLVAIALSAGLMVSPAARGLPLPKSWKTPRAKA